VSSPFPSLFFFSFANFPSLHRPVLGKYHKKSETSICKSMWNIWKSCRFVPNEGDIVFYQGETTKKQT
jgi:hypothetical protein